MVFFQFPSILGYVANFAPFPFSESLFLSFRWSKMYLRTITYIKAKGHFPLQLGVPEDNHSSKPAENHEKG